MTRYKILVIDDDRLLRESLRDVLSEKYDIAISGSGEEGIKYLKSHPVDLILLDIRLPGLDGIATLKLIRESGIEASILMMTAYEDVKSVITAMKMGAFDYLVKPLDIDELEVIIEKALETLKLKREVVALRKQAMCDFKIENIIGQSEGMKNALKMASKIAASHNTTVLIEGETGTGKEVIAKTIHYSSDRAGNPLISINCGAISRDLIESELFGYEPGAFTGGIKHGKKGKCELADGGTLFLDEISELMPSAQVKLLRFLEEREFYKVGGTKKIKVDTRIIAATNQPLAQCIERGIFREDLYYRLNVAKIVIPPLRERKEDLLPLTHLFLKEFNDKFRKNFNGVTDAAKAILAKHHWSGNIRELRNAVERIVLMENDKWILPQHLWFLQQDTSLQKPKTHSDEPEMISGKSLNMAEVTNHIIQQALLKSGGNKTQAAKLLGITRSKLLYRMRQ